MVESVPFFAAMDPAQRKVGDLSQEEARALITSAVASGALRAMFLIILLPSFFAAMLYLLVGK